MGASVLHEDAIFQFVKRRESRSASMVQTHRKKRGTLIVEGTCEPKYTITGITEAWICFFTIEKQWWTQKSDLAARFLVYWRWRNFFWSRSVGELILWLSSLIRMNLRTCEQVLARASARESGWHRTGIRSYTLIALLLDVDITSDTRRIFNGRFSALAYVSM